MHTRAAQVPGLEARGRALDAHKLLLLAGAALGDADAAFHASHAAHSAAQELRCLQVGRAPPYGASPGRAAVHAGWRGFLA